MGKIKCRTCQFSKDNFFKSTKHVLCKTDFTCAFCNKPTKWYSHFDDDTDLVGDALECKSCHNFIVYAIPDIGPDPKILIPKVWKDEIYLSRNSKEILVLRSYEDNQTVIQIDNTLVTNIEGILHFNSPEHLLKRVDSIIVYS